MRSLIAPWKDSIIEFAKGQLLKFQPQDDYCELLELIIIFLCGTPPRGTHFGYPGAIHRARWMARAILAEDAPFPPGAVRDFKWNISQ